METVLVLYFERRIIMANLIPYDIDKLQHVNEYKVSDNYGLLTEFINSDLKCAKVEGYTQKDARCCAFSLRASIKRYHFNSITACQRKGEVFLIKL
jgi:hypothetical protein